MTRSRPYTHVFQSTRPNDDIEHIKWCRRNLGQRGSDWDFAGSKNPTIFIYTEKYIPFYKLKFE